MKTEEAIKTLNAYYGCDCLGVDVQSSTTYFKINLPHDWGNELTLSSKKGEVFNVLQYGGYTSLLMCIKNSELVLL